MKMSAKQNKKVARARRKRVREEDNKLKMRRVQQDNKGKNSAS